MSKRENTNKYKRFIELLNFSNGKYNIIEVFKDFVTVYAIAIKNKFYYEQCDEEIYFETIKKYEKSELDIFSKLINELQYLYIKEREIRDILGEIYFQIGAIKKEKEQFFSPEEVGRTISPILIDGLLKRNEDFIFIDDFACGSGTLLLYCAKILDQKRVDYLKKVFYWGQDIDFICFCMAYIQTSLYGLPAIIVWGNTLTLKEYKAFYTPEYFIGEWKEKIEKRK